MSIIEVKNLSKKYLIRHQGQRQRYATLSDVISHKFKQLFADRKPRTLNEEQKKEDFWALQNVSFSVEQGDKIGIIGRNGAGKTTLLKILSRITEPTKGLISIKGRVASLLEVGTGFHQELSGRENIFLNGAILGMKKEEIKRKFDEIVSFSEIEKFLDTPVKRYSSGMYVRLAFAVAAHLEPEILIVDEVLAVGDAEFQKKCLGKMGEVSKEGRTVLFVSHNMSAVQTLCDNAIYLKNGKVEKNDDVSSVIRYYLSSFSASNLLREWNEDNAPGNENVNLLGAKVINKNRNDEFIEENDDFNIEIKFLNKKNKVNLDLTFHLLDEMGILVFVGSTVLDSKSNIYGKGFIDAKCFIPKNLLIEGIYTISRLLIVQDRGNVIFEINDVLNFKVIKSETNDLGWMAKKEGVIKPKLKWEIEYRET